MATQRTASELWKPSAERARRAVLTRYTRWLAEQRDLRFTGYDALWEWSVNDLERFWSSTWEFFDVRSSAPYERVLAIARCPARAGFPARSSTTPNTSSATRPTTGSPSWAPPSSATSPSSPGASCAP